MKCIGGTRNLPLILRANGSGILKWWIYGSFPVYTNMIENTGGVLSMARLFTIVGSIKTEAEHTQLQ